MSAALKNYILTAPTLLKNVIYTKYCVGMSENNFNFSTYKTSTMEVDDSMCALRLLQHSCVILNIYKLLEKSKRPHNSNCCSNFHGRLKVICFRHVYLHKRHCHWKIAKYTGNHLNQLDKQYYPPAQCQYFFFSDYFRETGNNRLTSGVLPNGTAFFKLIWNNL